LWNKEAEEMEYMVKDFGRSKKGQMIYKIVDKIVEFTNKTTTPKTWRGPRGGKRKWPSVAICITDLHYIFGFAVIKDRLTRVFYEDIKKYDYRLLMSEDTFIRILTGEYWNIWDAYWKGGLEIELKNQEFRFYDFPLLADNVGTMLWPALEWCQRMAKRNKTVGNIAIP
jgi:hypothetical protein